MKISQSDWIRYRDMMSRISKKAAADFDAKFLGKIDAVERKEIIDYAMALVQKYSEASSELACQMYERIAELSGVTIPPAEPAEAAKYGEVAKGINGTLKQSPEGKLCSDVVDRLVKRAGADTMLKNAERDRAQFAWVPHGDTCSFCIMLASRGWQNISRNALKNGHAEHIHAHCDCQYCVRFNQNTEVEGYDPDKYLEMYENAEGNKWRDKLNSMRREEEKRKSTDIIINDTIKKNDMNLQFFASKDKQYGKKIGKHARDFGLDPSVEEDRKEMKEIINNICREPDVVKIGTWRGQKEEVLFNIKGNDVVITKQDGEFVTVLKDGVINSAGVKNARIREI